MLAPAFILVGLARFLKYSNVFEGNTTDSKTLPAMVEKLRKSTSYATKKAVVVMDAGIATEENLKLLAEKDTTICA